MRPKTSHTNAILYTVKEINTSLNNESEVDFMNNKSKCEVIEKIMQSNILSYDEKIYYIKSFLLNYLQVSEIEWIWKK